MTAPIPPRRVVVVNLDETWNFAALVRRGALDVFADPDRTVEIHFRTIGNVDRTSAAAGRLAVWGAERPLIYGDDLESLTDDLIEDVDDLVEARIGDLAFVVVLDDPDTAPDQGMVLEPRFLARLEDEIHQRGSILRRTPQRWVCVRDRSGGTVHPRLDALIDALTYDPRMAHRQVADRVFRLRASRVGAQDLEVDARHFSALRTVVAMAVSGFPQHDEGERAAPTAADATTRNSPIGELIKAYTAFEIMLPGAPAPTTSAAVAELLDGHRRAAEAATPGLQPRLDGDDQAAKKIDEVLATLHTSMTPSGQDTGAANADRADLERRTELLRKNSRWWTAEGEREVMILSEDVALRLGAYVQRRIQEFADYRKKLENRISTEFDRHVRDLIRSIPMVGGGLSGASAVQLDGLLAKVVKARQDAERRTEQARALFMGALLPEKTGASGARRDGTMPELDLGRIEAYRKIVDAQAGMRTIYRGLMPRAYQSALLALGVAAGLTVFAHALGKAQGSFALLATMLETRSAALATAVILAFLIGLTSLVWRADLRQATFRQAVDDLQTSQGKLWSQVVALTDAAFTHVTLSRHILFFRLLEAEIARRRREEDASALAIAFEDIAKRGDTTRLVPLERAATHAQEMTPQLATLPPVRWIRRMLELSATFDAASPGPQTLRFVLSARADGRTTAPGGASGAFTASATIFRREQLVEVSILPDRTTGSSTVTAPGSAPKVSP